MDIGETIPVGVDGDLGVGHIAGGDAVDDGGDLSTGDGFLRLVGAVGVALEDLQLGEDVHGFVVGVRDVRFVAEGRVGGDYEREAHNQRQGQCENLLQISHGGLFPPFCFAG